MGTAEEEARPSGPVDMRRVVGWNVREIRRLRGWTQDDLLRGLGERGLSFMKITRPRIVALEKGRRAIDVAELLALAVVLGVAPQVLLYPPAGTSILADPARDPRSTSYPGRVIADWLWDPDGHELSTVGVSEWAVWFESAEMRERMTPGEWQAVAQRRRDEEGRREEEPGEKETLE